MSWNEEYDIDFDLVDEKEKARRRELVWYRNFKAIWNSLQQNLNVNDVPRMVQEQYDPVQFFDDLFTIMDENHCFHRENIAWSARQSLRLLIWDIGQSQMPKVE